MVIPAGKSAYEYMCLSLFNPCVRVTRNVVSHRTGVCLFTYLITEHLGADHGNSAASESAFFLSKSLALTR